MKTSYKENYSVIIFIEYIYSNMRANNYSDFTIGKHCSKYFT